jgi:hypothetical protein
LESASEEADKDDDGKKEKAEAEDVEYDDLNEPNRRLAGATDAAQLHGDRQRRGAGGHIVNVGARCHDVFWRTVTGSGL